MNQFILQLFRPKPFKFQHLLYIPPILALKALHEIHGVNFEFRIDAGINSEYFPIQQ
jgi:hypothetical protein